MSSSSTRWNKKKPNRDASRVVCKTFREDTSSTASVRNIPNNHFGSSKARIDDDVKTTCHEPIPFRQVMSPNPHSLERRLVSDPSVKRWRRSTASQISIATLLHRLESVERQNEELRQRMSERWNTRIHPLSLESQPCWFPCKIILRLPPFSLGFGSRHVLYESSPKLECAEKCAQGRGPL